MPFDPASIASIAGNSVPNNSDMFNAFATLGTNIMNQRFTQNMYKQTREDNLEFWRMQNQYNSPVEQMKRFREAGLNPNLIYGQGNSGPAGPIPTPDIAAGTNREPRLDSRSPDLMNVLLASADLEIKNAQADNIKVETEVRKQEALLKSVLTRRSEFDLGLEEKMLPYSTEYRRELARKIGIEAQTMVDRNAREAALNSSNIAEAFERMQNLQEQRLNFRQDRFRSKAEVSRIMEENKRTRQMVEILKKDGTLRDLEIKLRDAGVNPNDPLWQRYLGQILDGFFKEGAEYMNNTPTTFKRSELGPR